MTRLTDLPDYLLAHILSIVIGDVTHSPRSIHTIDCPSHPVAPQCARWAAIPEHLNGIARLGRSMSTALVLALGRRTRELVYHDIRRNPGLLLISCSPVMQSYSAVLRCPCREGQLVSHYQQVRVLRMLGTFPFPKLKHLDISHAFTRHSPFLMTLCEIEVDFSPLVEKLICNLSSSVEKLRIPNRKVFCSPFRSVGLPFLTTLEIQGHDYDDCCGTPGLTTTLLLGSLASSPEPPNLRKLSLMDIQNSPGPAMVRIGYVLRHMLSTVTNLNLLHDWNSPYCYAFDSKAVDFLGLFPSLQSLEWSVNSIGAGIESICRRCPLLTEIIFGPIDLRRVTPNPYSTMLSSTQAPVAQQEHGRALADKLQVLRSATDVLGREMVKFAVSCYPPGAFMPWIIGNKVQLRSVALPVFTNMFGKFRDLCVANCDTLSRVCVTFWSDGVLNNPVSEDLPCPEAEWTTFCAAIASLKRLSHLALLYDVSNIHSGVCPDLAARTLETCLKSMGQRAVHVRMEFASEDLENDCLIVVTAICHVLECARKYNHNLEVLDYRFGLPAPGKLLDLVHEQEQIWYAVQGLIFELKLTALKLQNLCIDGEGSWLVRSEV